MSHSLIEQERKKTEKSMIDKYSEAEALTGIACRLLDDFYGGRHVWKFRINVSRLSLTNGYDDILGQLFGSHTAATAAFRPFLDSHGGDDEYSTHLAWCAFDPMGEWQRAYTWAWKKVLEEDVRLLRKTEKNVKVEKIGK